MDNILQTVSFGVIAFNEHRYLPDLLSDLLKQTYPKRLIEVILVDGESTDDTWQIMVDFQSKHRHEYSAVKILKNPKRIQPAGWNVVIENSTEQVLLRIDAHARLPEEFIEKCMECINSGESVCGGSRENIIDEDTPWKQMLLIAERSVFGSGFAPYRQRTKKKYVKTVFHAAYRKEVIDCVGVFNEDLVRTEDNEYHYRIYIAGYKICYAPEIHSYYQTRSTFRSMLRQKYMNGLWIGRTLFICPGCISLFHLVPFAFVIAIWMTAIVGALGFIWPAAFLWLIYGVANLAITVMAIIYAKKKEFVLISLPFLFLGMHFFYGIGTLVGIIYRR